MVRDVKYPMSTESIAELSRCCDVVRYSKKATRRWLVIFYNRLLLHANSDKQHRLLGGDRRG